MVIEPPHVALFTTTTATHANDFFGLPGTGRRIDFRSGHLMRVENGSVTQVRRIYDFTGILLQLGVLRAKPAKP
jgi:predicted ester cyclase